MTAVGSQQHLCWEHRQYRWAPVLSQQPNARTSNYKDMILKAKDIDTRVTGRTTGHPVRALRNQMTREYLKKGLRAHLSRNWSSLHWEAYEEQ